jgi:TolB-like protein/DNA-binding winged helix-turn-helix (wHTH) protein
MAAIASIDVSLFEDFRFSPRAGVLSQRDQRGVFVPLAIGGRGLDILAVLVEHRGDLVSRDDIMSAVWPQTSVEDGNLSVQISALRRVLDNGRSEGSLIQTGPGRGYRFVGGVTRPEPDSPAAAEALSAATASVEAADITQAVSPGPRRRFPRALVILVMALCLSGIGLVVFATSDHRWSDKAAAPPRLSIVVLPFSNLGEDREQQYFVDAITEDLTTDLSRMSESFVISRNTAFNYRGKSIDAKQIGRELGVRYVLEGSVRRSGNQVRVNVQLIDAESNAHLWAERFDRDVADLFDLQNEITSRISNALSVRLINIEAARPRENPDAVDYVFQGRAALTRGLTRDSLAEAVSLFERALSRDQGSVLARSYLAN